MKRTPVIERLILICVMAGVSLFPIGCATRSFVHQEVQTIVDLLQELFKEQRKMEQQHFQMSQEQQAQNRQKVEATLRDERERVSQVASVAESAAETAKKALAKAEATEARLDRLLTKREKRVTTRKHVETLVIPFDSKKWELDDRSQESLSVAAEQLKVNPNLSVELEGYTDTSGSPHYNLELSQRRVETVRRFLIEKGVELPRIQAVALGSANPIGDNKTQEGRRKNRRVALKLFTLEELPEAIAPPDDSAAPQETLPLPEPPPGGEDAES